MGARPTITRESCGPSKVLEILLAIQVVVVVENPERVDARDLSSCALLPIYPPEVEPLSLQVGLEHVKVRVERVFICWIALDRALLGRVKAKGLGNSLVLILESPNAVRGMIVGSNLKAAVVELGKEA